ncbi:hypothetical protein ACEPAG_1097 [Sanghuangporus baumii]
MPPQRRQSLAPTSSYNGSRLVLGRKRAQSLVPREATRHLVPRKSILKSTHFTFTSNPQQNENDPPPVIENLGESMMENSGIQYTAEISDNTTRKSLGRRVSFAPLASFRVFETNDNTNSTNGPSSSPTPASPAESVSSPLPSQPLPPIQLSNENDYPGRRSNTGPIRRASTVSDYGERSMSLDMEQESDDISEPPTDPIFFHDAANGGSDYGPPSTDFEEDTEEEDDDDEEMEITEAIAMSIDRKRSLSIAQQHELARRSSLSSLASQRLSSIKFSPAATSRPADEEAEGNDAEEDVTTNTEATQESEAPMEFTIALGQPLKKPRPPSSAWLALKALVNGTSGDDNDNEDNGDEMELSNALSRLQQARSSIGSGGQTDGDVVNGALQDDSFTNTESSMDMSIDAGDRTINVTSLMGRVSNLEISGDESETNTRRILDEDFAGPLPNADTAPLNIYRKENVSGQAISSKPLRSSIFSAPVPSRAPTATASASENEMPIPQRSHSPGALKSSDPSRPPLALKSSLKSSVFSVPPTPSRIPVFVSPTKPKASAPLSPMKKRLAEAPDATSDAGHPSPAKKRHLENTSNANNSSEPPNPAPVPTTEETADAPLGAPSVPRESLGGIRRPSGYFAQRRSLTPGMENAPNAPRSPSPAANGLHALTDSSRPKNASAPSTFLSSASQDENTNLNANLRPVDADEYKNAAFSAASTPPIVTATADHAQENGVQNDAMEVQDEKQSLAMQRKSLVSSDMPPPDDEYDDVPPISIQEFFLMTGIKFHDYTIPRRSTIHPSQLQGNRRDSSVPSSMADYLMATVVHVPQLELYRLITRDLQTFIDNSMKIYHDAEEEVAKLTPILFREFAQSNEEGREELMHQLKLIKANRLIAAKERWYDVRSRWIQGLLETVDRGFVELEKDRDTLTSIIDKAQALLPALRHQHAQAQAQLERERIDIEEVENSDPAYLEELKITIEEQNQLLEVYKTDVADGTAKIERLEGKLAELEAQRLENVQAIETAERRIVLNKTSTRAEVFRLKGMHVLVFIYYRLVSDLQFFSFLDELEWLQALHSWRLAKVSQQLIELVFEEQFFVSIPCMKFRPVTPKITIKRIHQANDSKRSKRIDLHPLFSELVVRQAEVFARSLSAISLKRVLEALSDFWTSCALIRTQFVFLGIKYPLQLELVETDGSTNLRVVASILFSKRATKVLVAFVFTPEVLAGWPFVIRKLQCEVKTVYGTIDPEEIRSAIMERLSESSIEDNHACLLDSCVEAASRFE